MLRTCSYAMLRHDLARNMGLAHQLTLSRERPTALNHVNTLCRFILAPKLLITCGVCATVRLGTGVG